LLLRVVDGVSWVNALALAAERGIAIEERTSREPTAFSGLLRLSLATDQGSATIAGTVFAPDIPRVVEIDGVPIEAEAQGHLLFFRSRDVPGVIGKIGTILGAGGVNIAGFQLGRTADGAHAISIVHVDSPVPAELLRELQKVAEVVTARALTV
jgi:D-3-phosphoglycerate dehydrogenase